MKIGHTLANVTRAAKPSPSLVLSFADTSSLDPRVTFTRASSATRVNASGVIESVASNAPRFDHDPVTLAARGFLIEEQRTNLRTQSQSISATASPAYAAHPGTLTEGVSVATPIADLTVASRFALGSGVSLTGQEGWNFGSGLALTVGTMYTQSVFAKADGATVFRLRSNVTGQMFDIPFSGTVPAPTGTIVAASREAFGGGWFRFSWTFVAVSTTPGNRGDHWAIKSTSNDGVAGYFVTGAQLEVGAFPTSYIPTTTAQVTRAADSAVISGTNFSQFYNQSEGTVYAEFVNGIGLGPLSNSPGVWGIDNSAVGSFNGYGIRQDVSASNRSNLDARARYAPASVNTAIAIGPARALIVGETLKTAFFWNQSTIGGTTNGLQVQSTANNVAQFMTPHNRMLLGSQNVGGAPQYELNGHIRAIRYYPRRLSNAEVQALTS